MNDCELTIKVDPNKCERRIEWVAYEPVWTGEIMGIPCAVFADGKRFFDLNAFMTKLEALTDPADVMALAAFARGTGIPEVTTFKAASP